MPVKHVISLHKITKSKYFTRTGKFPDIYEIIATPSILSLGARVSRGGVVDGSGANARRSNELNGGKLPTCPWERGDTATFETMANSAVHDRVNLLRLVTRLEDDVANRQSWGSSGMSARVKATNASLVSQMP